VVTDVTVVTCSSINPFSKCTVDGPDWHRVNKDLYLGQGYVSKAYLVVKRKQEDDLKSHEEVVTDLEVGRIQRQHDPTTKDERWESRPGGIWIKLSTKRHDKMVTGVDVLFGADAADPRSNWQVQHIPLLLDIDREAAAPHLTVRKGPALSKVDKPVPRIRKDGKFKIMQVADLHLSTGLGKCRDALPAGQECEADPRTLDFVLRMIESEKPDFVILSGDQVNGDTAPDAQTAIFKYSELFARHKIPYAGIFGNHDDEGNLDRKESMLIMDGLPYSLSTAGPEDIDGVGNYYIEILGRGSTAHSALTLYLLDTHSYSPSERQYKGYDWLKPSQISWFKNTSQSLKRKHKEYTHIHMDLAFIHIPLPEYRNEDGQSWVGNWTENPTAPGLNSGFRDVLVEEGVLVVSCGHEYAFPSRSLNASFR
jgi:hypothetical protein